MKAVVLTAPGGPEKLAYQDTPRPAPAPGEVRVRLFASALNRRDIAVIDGRHPGMQTPIIIGSDGAGEIDAVGEGVDAGLIGQAVVIYPARAWGDDERFSGRSFRVLGMPDAGTFADYICAPQSDVAPKPAHLSFEQAAATPLAGLTSWRAAVTHGEVGPGMNVLVTGAGSGVSTFAIQWAALNGARVFVTSSSEEKIAKAQALGAIGGGNYREPGYAAALGAQAKGFHLIIDSAGGDGFNALLDTLRPGGRYVFFGATLGEPSSPPELRKLFLRHIRIQGSTMGSPREFAAMLAFAAAHKVEPAIDRVLPLSQAAEGVALLKSFGQAGKIVLRH